jgi:hypothetical protein
MFRRFQGGQDESAIVLAGVFPDSEIIFSTPFEFEKKRTGVYVEGDIDKLETLFGFLKQLVSVSLEEKCFGRWVALTPPDDEYAPHIVVHYEALSKMDKIQLLGLVLRQHLAWVCDLRLAAISLLTVKVHGTLVQRSVLFLPEGFVNGNIILSEQKEGIKPAIIGPFN